jgi:glutamate dehydrogenase/leucine dehydrogenase
MISASTDIMSVDVGCDTKMMNIVKDTYKTLLNTQSVNIDAVVVGKGTKFGGLESYSRSMAFGIARTIFFIEKQCENYDLLKQTKLQTGGSKKSIIIKGFNKNGQQLSKILLEHKKQSFKIVGVSNNDIGIYSQIGIDPDSLIEYLNKHNTLEGFVKNHFTANELITKKCDIVVVTDSGFSIDEKLAKELNCKVLVDGSNTPSPTNEAEEYLLNKGILLVPSLLSYSGEFICGYLEWLKNLEHRNLTILFKRHEKNQRQELIKLLAHQPDTELKWEGPTEDELVLDTITDMIDGAFTQMINISQSDKLSLRSSAYSIGLNRIYLHYKEKGISL